MDDGMEIVSAPLDPRSRKTLAVFATRLAAVGQERAARAIGCDISTVSRMQSQQFERFALLMTALGLKPVPVDAKCYAPDHVASLEYFARRGMSDKTIEPDTGIFFERGK